MRRSRGKKLDHGRPGSSLQVRDVRNVCANSARISPDGVGIRRAAPPGCTRPPGAVRGRDAQIFRGQQFAAGIKTPTRSIAFALACRLVGKVTSAFGRFQPEKPSARANGAPPGIRPDRQPTGRESVGRARQAQWSLGPRLPGVFAIRPPKSALRGEPIAAPHVSTRVYNAAAARTVRATSSRSSRGSSTSQSPPHCKMNGSISIQSPTVTASTQPPSG